MAGLAPEEGLEKAMQAAKVAAEKAAASPRQAQDAPAAEITPEERQKVLWLLLETMKGRGPGVPFPDTDLLDLKWLGGGRTDDYIMRAIFAAPKGGTQEIVWNAEPERDANPVMDVLAPEHMLDAGGQEESAPYASMYPSVNKIYEDDTSTWPDDWWLGRPVPPGYILERPDGSWELHNPEEWEQWMK